MKNIILFIFLLVGQFAFSQQTGIQGIIKDKANAEVLPFVTIKIFQKGKIKGGAHSDFDGNYKMVNLVPGKYRLEISYAGYETKAIKKVKVKSNKMVMLDILLEQPVREEVKIIQYDQPLFTPDVPPIKSKQQAIIKGKIMDVKSGELLLYATVALYQGEQLIVGGQTDFDGNYQFDSLIAGTYDLKVSYVGYKTSQITNIVLINGKILEVDISLSPIKIGQEIIIISCGRPLINFDNMTSGKILFAEDIDKLPIKN